MNEESPSLAKTKTRREEISIDGKIYNAQEERICCLWIQVLRSGLSEEGEGLRSTDCSYKIVPGMQSPAHGI